MSTARPAVARWLSSAPRTGDDFTPITAVELAQLASRALGRPVSVEILIASAFDAGLPVDSTAPWAFRLPGSWLLAQRDPAAALLAMLAGRKAP